MKRKAIIELKINPEYINSIYKAIFPETVSAPTSRTKVMIKCEKQKIKIIIETDTTSSLRAALNSYLSWISSIFKTLKYVKE